VFDDVLVCLFAESGINLFVDRADSVFVDRAVGQAAVVPNDVILLFLNVLGRLSLLLFMREACFGRGHVAVIGWCLLYAWCDSGLRCFKEGLKVGFKRSGELADCDRLLGRSHLMEY